MSSKTGVLRRPAASSGGFVPSLQVMGWGGVPGQRRKTNCVPVSFAAVLAAYENRCAISGLAVPELLNASHIIPWCESVERRADPRNGICLNALYDRAFDRGLIAFDEQLRVMVSPRLKKAGVCGEAEAALIGVEGRVLNLPGRFAPDREAVRWHRDRVLG